MQTITGTIVKFLPRQEGESQRGHWVRAGFVIEYGDEYKTKAAFSLFGEERLQMCKGLKEGCLVQVSFNPESREYNDRWYTDLRCVSIYEVIADQRASAPTPAQTPVYNQMPPVASYPQTPVRATDPQHATSQPTMPVEEELPF